MNVLALRPLAPERRIRCIDVYADVACPFTYVGLHRLVAARDARAPDMAIRVRAWPLEWINGRPLEPRRVAAEIEALRPIAPGLFAGFDASRFPTTTVPALALTHAAYERGDVVGELTALRLRHALFEEGRDVGDPEVVGAIADELGVTPHSTVEGHAAVRREWERGRTRGVQGSPHFFAGAHDWFCPSLRIRHDDDGFEVAVDTLALDAFYRVLFA